MFCFKSESNPEKKVRWAHSYHSENTYQDENINIFKICRVPPGTGKIRKHLTKRFKILSYGMQLEHRLILLEKVKKFETNMS